MIVCFRNEAPRLTTCLQAILQQRYAGPFEVLAVDDNSGDGSAELVRQLQRKFSAERLRLLSPPPTRPGKKDALTFGIQAARYERLLLTDADCRPASELWLREMTLPLNHHQVVLGVGDYYAPAGWPARLQAFEARYVALKYLAFARSGYPYMGVGRNLAYRKDFFRAAGGFAQHADLPGGDDDILISQHAPATATTTVTAAKARTLSVPQPSWRSFLRQRARHQSAGAFYRPQHQLALGCVALTHGLFYLLGLYLLFSSWWPLLWLIYGFRMLLVMRAHRQLSLGTDLRWRWYELVVYDATVCFLYLYLILPQGRQPSW